MSDAVFFVHCILSEFGKSTAHKLFCEFGNPVSTPLFLRAKRVESIDRRANPDYHLCLGAGPTPPPSVNLETAVSSITYTETVENYRCLWDNFFATPMNNHLSCH